MTRRSDLTLRPWPSRAEIGWIAAFWLALSVLSVLREALEPWEDAPIQLGRVVDTVAEFGIWALATPLVFWIVARYPVGRGAWAARLTGQVAVALALAIVVEGVAHGVIRPAFRGPPPPDRAWTLAGSILRLRMLDEFLIGLSILAAGYARAALADARVRQAEADRLLTEQARLEGQLTEARLGALRAQLHPHFLFNTLNAVSALVERDPSGVRTMVARLSSLLRRVLDAGDAQEVSLREETAFIRDYLDVQRVRFQERLETEEAYAPDALDALVPPLVLQPLVENAVVHGVAGIEDGTGTVRVSAHVDRQPAGDHLVLVVEDNGPGLDPSPDADASSDRQGSGGVGLANTRARLAALYGDNARLEVSNRPDGGVCAKVVLPFRTPDASPVTRPVDPADSRV